MLGLISASKNHRQNLIQIESYLIAAYDFI